MSKQEMFDKMKELEAELGVEIITYGAEGYNYEIYDQEGFNNALRESIDEMEYLCDNAPMGYLLYMHGPHSDNIGDLE